MSYFDELKKKVAESNENQQTQPTKAADVVIPVPEPDTSKPKPDVIKQIKSQKPLITQPDKTPKQFFLSQTIIKQVTNRNGEYKEICPRAFYEMYIQRNYRDVTLPMLHGIYGETLVLGGGAKGQKVTDLPRHKKTGNKLTIQLNIEEQAHRVPIWLNEKGISIIPGVNTQVPIVKRFDNNTLIATEIDIFPTPFLNDGKYNLAVIDLKFTSNIDNTFGNYCWGAPEFIDHIQADLTYWLLQDFDMELNIKYNPEKEPIYRSIFENEAITKMIESEQIIFVYFVIGYNKQPLEEQVLFIIRSYREPNGSLFRQNEWKERARKTLAQMSQWEADGWPPLQDTWCNKCKVSQANGGYCKHNSLQII
jgi:hypothetical protein